MVELKFKIEEDIPIEIIKFELEKELQLKIARIREIKEEIDSLNLTTADVNLFEKARQEAWNEMKNKNKL
ncbi:MAG TPA: hypothetical protein VMV49_06295 [Candidatus Deferrimicrobium sp.]|nr:hypothetical protein [Candidatus Deferrimicrobium sp.]